MVSNNAITGRPAACAVRPPHSRRTRWRSCFPSTRRHEWIEYVVCCASLTFVLCCTCVRCSVPYRDSTLTYLLQDSLEKNSKVRHSLATWLLCSAHSKRRADACVRSIGVHLDSHASLTLFLGWCLCSPVQTLMFVQVSPVKNDSAESICSLRFAERVRKVELGKVEAVKKK